ERDGLVGSPVGLRVLVTRPAALVQSFGHLVVLPAVSARSHSSPSAAVRKLRKTGYSCSAARCGAAATYSSVTIAAPKLVPRERPRSLTLRITSTSRLGAPAATGISTFWRPSLASSTISSPT